MKGITHGSFLWGHDIVCCSARLPVRVSSAQQTSSSGCTGGEVPWSLLCSSPKRIDIPAWGSRRQEEDLPSASATCSRVPCSPSPDSVMPGPWGGGGMPTLGPPTTHRPPWRGLRGGRCGAAVAPVGPHGRHSGLC